MILPLCGLALLPAVLFAQAVPLTQDNGNGTDSTYWGGAANKGIIAGTITGHWYTWQPGFSLCASEPTRMRGKRSEPRSRARLF